MSPRKNSQPAKAVIMKASAKVLAIIASEKFAQIILEQAANAIIICDNNGTIIRASERANNLVGTDMQGLSFDSVFEQFYPVLVTGNPAHQEISRKPVCLSVLYRNEIHPGSVIALIRNGQAKQSFVINFSLLSQERATVGYSISFTDITNQQKAEEALAKAKDELEIKVKERTRELALANEQLKQYSHRSIQIHEEERKRVAYELREELAQTLAAVKLEAELMTKKADALVTNVNAHVDNIKKMVGTAVYEARTFSNELRPSVLENLGLFEALGEMIRETNKNGELGTVLKMNGVKRRLPDEIETALFRITQEAMNNIRRHSGATKAKVTVGFLETGIKLTIIDNGKGFDTESKTEQTLKSTYGLISMKERMHQIGGEFKIKSELRKGTTITVTVPLQSN